MKTKLLGITLILCILVTAFAGMTVAAAGNLFSDEQWKVEGSGQMDTDGELSLTLGTSMPCVSKRVGVKPEKNYRLSFDYALNLDLKGEIKVGGETADGLACAIVEPIRLEATGGVGTYESYSTVFIPGYLNKIPIVYATVYFEGVPLNEWSEGAFNIRNIRLEEVVSGVVANGSAEYLDENGDPFGISGGTLVQDASLAKDGDNVMKIVGGETMTMDLAMVVQGEHLLKIRGFMKAVNFAAESDKVTIKFYSESVSEQTLISQKVYTYSATDTNYKDIQNNQWEYFRFSALPHGKIIASFTVEGNGTLYVDGVTIDKDKNIIRSPRFVEDDSAWAVSGESDFLEVVKTDGDCPDGATYVYLNKTATLNQSDVPVEENEKYLVSFWFNVDGSTASYFLKLLLNKEDAGATDAYEQLNGTTWQSKSSQGAQWPMLQFIKGTNSEWEQIAILVTVPKGVSTLSPAIIYNMVENTSDYMAISNLSIEKIEEESIQFFKPYVKESTGTSNIVNVLEPYSVPFVTVLGKPVEVLEEVDTEKLAATCLVPTIDGDPQKVSDSKVIFAWYTMEGGMRRLQGIKVGEKPVLGTNRLEGFDNMLLLKDQFRLKGAPQPLKYMDYPSVSVSKTDFEDATLIRAFCWDDIKGLKAISNIGSIQ